MKKFLSIILLAAAFVAPTALAQSSALPDLGGETITIAVENAYKPFNFVDEDTGEPIGWDYDVVNELCARLNCVPEYVETSWDGMILAVSNGEFDMAADGITITPERDELVDFSTGYVALNQVILARTGEDRFTDVASFAATDLMIGTQPGTTNYIVAEGLFGAERIVAYETFPLSVQALLAGDVDAVILDDVAGIGYVGVNAENLQIVGEPLTSGEELGFIFENGSELRDSINAGLASMTDDYTLEYFNYKWFAGEGVALPDLEGQTITVAVENAYQPFNFIDETTGAAVGWDYDTINEICARLNCVPEFIETSWDGMILSVSNGEFDLAADGITITPERDELVDFSTGYVALNQVILGRAGEERFSDVPSFVADASLTLGTQPGTTNYIVGEGLVGADRIVAYETFPISVQALLAGDVDAVILDDVAGLGYVGVNSENLQIYGDPLSAGEKLGFIFENGSTLTRAFNQALVDMRLDGSLQAINTKWFADTGE